LFYFGAVWRSPLCAMIPTGVIVFFHFRGFLIKYIAANFGRLALGKKIRLRTKSSSVFAVPSPMLGLGSPILVKVSIRL
jgi:hypothetical protein